MTSGENSMEQQRLELVQHFTASLGSFIIGRNTDMNDSITKISSSSTSSTSSTSSSKSAIAIIKEQKEQCLYGPTLQPNALAPSLQTSTSLMDPCLHRDDSDPVGGAIIAVPALDLQSPDEQTEDKVISRSAGASAVLPSLGKSAKVGFHQMDNGKKPNIPAMVASVLGQGNNSQVKLFSEGTMTKKSASADLLNDATAAATDIEYAAAQNFGRPISYTRSSAPQASGAMARVLFDSFSSLVESRIKTWTLRLLRHSLSSGDEDSRVQLMSLLATKNIELSAIVTSFGVVGTKNQKNSSSSSSLPANCMTYSREHCDFIIPIHLDVHVDLKLHGNTVCLHFQTDGTAAAIFHKETQKLTYFDCKIDANSLVSDMIAQARLVVLKTVAQVTVSKVSGLFPTSISAEKSLSQFGSSLNLSSNATDKTSNNHQVQTSESSMKSSSQLSLQPHTSSLRPSASSGSNSTQSLLKNNKKRSRSRSVTWDTSVSDLQKVHSIHKKPRRMNSLKRSIKSFGKPDSDYFQSAKNATFSEFGHLTQNPNISNFNQKRRDQNEVSIKTHHLSTMNLGVRHSLSRSSFVGGSRSAREEHEGKNMNASFGIKSSTTPPSLISSHSLLRKPTFTELARNAKYSQPKPKAQNSLLSLQTLLDPSKSKKDLKRTPTMLENIFLKKTQDNNSNHTSKNANWNV